jgi:hypothetical protein
MRMVPLGKWVAMILWRRLLHTFLGELECFAVIRYYIHELQFSQVASKSYYQ